MLKLCDSIKGYFDFFYGVEQIICFGAGKYSRHLEELDSKIIFLNKLSYFVDNNSKKRTLEISGRRYKIYPFNKLDEIKDGNFVILITIFDYCEALKQVESKVRNKNIKICLLFHILGLKQEEYALSRKIPSNIRILSSPAIPKIIHYFWFGGNPLPSRYKEWIQTWRSFCPDYEIIEWNESNYDITKNKYMYQAYQTKKWGFVPDYARLDVIYKYGGIYLDTDVELIANLDDLLYQKAFACFETNERVAFGLGFGAGKENPLIKELRDQYDNLTFITPEGKLNLIASPTIQTEYLLLKGLKQNGEYQIIEGMTIFPEKMLSGLSGTTRRIRLADYTRAIHHYEGTWVPEEKKYFSNLLLKVFSGI